MILNLDGIPSTQPRGDAKVFFARDPQGAWRPNEGDLSFNIEAECLRVHDALAARIFGGLPNYHAVLPSAVDLLTVARTAFLAMDMTWHARETERPDGNSVLSGV